MQLTVVAEHKASVFFLQIIPALCDTTLKK